jgi:hypothetical protein
VGVPEHAQDVDLAANLLQNVLLPELLAIHDLNCHFSTRRNMCS